jgi:hypothetical protein
MNVVQKHERSRATDLSSTLITKKNSLRKQSVRALYNETQTRHFTANSILALRRYDSFSLKFCFVG